MKRGFRAVHALYAVLGVGVLAGGLWFAQRGEEPVAPAPTVTATPPPPPRKELVTRCQNAGAPQRLFDFAKPEVKPVFSEPIGPSRVALGFAQTSRMAIGMTLSAANLEGTVVTRDDQPSPLLSVVPAVRGSDPQFLVERAASSLQTARAVAASPPFTIGLRDRRIAVRRDKKDSVLWDSPWETLSVPEVLRIDARRHAVAFRGGGARGSVLLGKLNEQGEAVGDLVTLAIDAQRIGEPALRLLGDQILVAVDAGPTNELGQIFVGVGAQGDLPTQAKRVAAITELASVPALVGLPGRALFLSWTEGPLGSQKLRGRVFDRELEPRGETLTLSQPGADAHHGVATMVGDRIVTVYFVRLPTNNHELWVSGLVCETTEE